MPISVEQAAYSTYYYEQEKIDDREYNRDNVDSEYSEYENVEQMEFSDSERDGEIREEEKGQNIDTEA